MSRKRTATAGGAAGGNPSNPSRRSRSAQGASPATVPYCAQPRYINLAAREIRTSSDALEFLSAINEAVALGQLSIFRANAMIRDIVVQVRLLYLELHRNGPFRLY